MSDAPRPLVLIAEDEAIASMALRAQLEALDYEVVGPARDGDEALALGSSFPVDVAVLDQRMPRRTGIEAAGELYNEAPTPVVLLTGFSSADLPDPIPRPPIFATLTKPVGLAELRAGLARARADFAEWYGADPETERAVEKSRSERLTIARAVRQVAAGGSILDAAIALRQRAHQQDRPLVEIARAILADTAGP